MSRARALATFTSILWVLASGGCAPGSPEAPKSAEAIEPLCAPGVAWRAGAAAFVERTAQAGLTGVAGQRLSAVDLDLDGDADLLVRAVGASPQDVGGDPSQRTAWVLENRGGAFVDVSESSGFFAARGAAQSRPGDVMAFADVDNDGDLDAWVGVNTDGGGGAGETSEILLNHAADEGQLRFTLHDGGDVRRAGAVDVPAAGVFVDADRDGDVDLFVAEHNTADFEFVGNRIYANDGAGHFMDMTDAWGLASLDWVRIADINAGRAHTRSWSGAACDLNDDGSLELLVGSYGRSPNHLWQGRLDADGVPAFTNESVASGYAYDDDLTYSDNQMFACWCVDNPDAAGCAEAVTPLISCANAGWNPTNDTEPFRLGGNDATALCGDLDNDGDLDVVTTTIKHWWAGSGSDGSDILVNASERGGPPRFQRPGRAATGMEIDHGDRVDWDEGIMTGALLDFDNDGRLDIYLGASDYPGNRGLLFHNESAAGAVRVAPVATPDFFEHNRSHGVAVADFDLDGDLDVVVGHSRSRCGSPNDCYPTANVRYFENTAGNGQNWVALTLEGSRANRAAIGARVTVSSGALSQVFEVGGGFGHYGAQNDLAVHVGLGDRCEPVDVTIRWPDAPLTEQRVTVVPGRRFHVIQGEEPTVAAAPGSAS